MQVQRHQRGSSPSAHRRTDPAFSAGAGGCEANELDPGLHERHEDWLREQYLRDLAVLERCEQCRDEEAGCPSFFLCMGDLVRMRGTR